MRRDVAPLLVFWVLLGLVGGALAGDPACADPICCDVPCAAAPIDFDACACCAVSGTISDDPTLPAPPPTADVATVVAGVIDGAAPLVKPVLVPTAIVLLPSQSVVLRI